MLSHHHRSFRMDLPVSRLLPIPPRMGKVIFPKWNSYCAVPSLNTFWFLFTFPVKFTLSTLWGTLDHGPASLLLLLCCGPPCGHPSLSLALVPPMWTLPVYLFMFGYAVYSAQITSIQHVRHGCPSMNPPRMNSESALSALWVPLQAHLGWFLAQLRLSQGIMFVASMSRQSLALQNLSDGLDEWVASFSPKLELT